MENYMMIDGVKIPISDETLESIKTSRKKLTLVDLYRKLPIKGYYISSIDNTIRSNIIRRDTNNMNLVNTYQRAKQLQAIVIMMNVANYLNDEPEVYPNNNNVSTIYYNTRDDIIQIQDNKNIIADNAVYFKTVKLAKQAIKIIGKNTIKLALTGHGHLTKKIVKL